MAKDTKDAKKGVLLQTPPFVLSFPQLYVAVTGDLEGSKPKFGATGIWTPGNFSPADKKLWAAIGAELNRVSMRDFKKAWKELPDNVKRGLRDGSAKDGLAGYGAGTKFANMTTHNRPGTVLHKRGPDNKWLKVPAEKGPDYFFPGAICRATVNVYSYGLKPGSKGKGVAIGLINIQFLKKGPRLDNRVDAADDFNEDADAQWLDDDGGDDGDFGGDDADDFGGGDDEDDFN